jgi:hypothetical protein
MEKITYILAGLVVVKLAHMAYKNFNTPDLDRPTENQNIPELTKQIQENKDKLSKHDDNRSVPDVEDYYNDSSDQ